MSEVRRWRIILEFSADEKKAKEVRETIYTMAINPSSYSPNITLEPFKIIEPILLLDNLELEEIRRGKEVFEKVLSFSRYVGHHSKAGDEV